MKVILNNLLRSCLILVICLSCSKEDKSDLVVVGLESEIQTLNPLYTMSEVEANISELLFLGLVGHDWDYEKGEPTSFPVLASSIVWENDSSSVLISLRNDVKWGNGKDLTADDVIFSFDLYSDKSVQSRFYGTFYNYYLNKDLSIDLKKTFEIIDPQKFRINFLPHRNTSCYDFDFPILPKYLFEKVHRSDLALSDTISITSGTGPYKIKEWKKNQYVKLIATSESIYSSPTQIKELIFKIIPDYTSRLYQLKNNDIDLTEFIKPEDVENLASQGKFVLKQRTGREYDYLGLRTNSAENKNSAKTGLFDSPRIRKAISMAINRESIVQEHLRNKGSLMSNPVAPIFSSVLNKNVNPLPFDLNEAKLILNSEGWNDSNNDGYLDKNGNMFSFTLNFPSGNPLREYTAIRIQNNLKAAGIKVELKGLEPTVFFEKMFNKQFEAWLAGWSIPVPLNLKPYWHSDPKLAQGNLSSYKNKRVDEILNALDLRLPNNVRNNLIKEFQKIISEDQPVVFLFWIDNSVAINSRLQNVKVTPLATIQKCWEWKIN
ncbi:MAG: hypothetical protein FIA82_10940 [Melioribacter sp.]|nr:hypothetical protein [Melioribacter sp.]